MFRKYSRQISAVVLCFFTWTSGGLFSIANAAQIEAKKAKAQKVEKKGEGSEERFAKATEEMEEILSDSKEGVEAKKGRLRAKKAEVDSLDGEMRRQFAETEKKLKDAKLPAEILERHRKFVKHYDDNMAELKGNLDRIDKAKDKAEAEAGLEKARRHLEKTKAPSRHQKLDPNNLPHRQPKVIKREPRMKKEEFEKDLKKDKHAWKNQKRVMLASTGSTAGLLTPDDLAETIEVQLTPEIRAKALELGHNPVKIYEWVRNNIEFVPTWGSIQGAQMTMQTRQGNAFDTSSLLIALLRAAGINARYVTGTVELPVEKTMNWAGGFTDPMAALDFMSSGGIPTTALTAAGKVEKARFEHVWVEAWIDFRPSRGAKHINGKGDTWIPLDPSYKQYNYTQGIDIKTAVPFDAQAFLTQIQSAATVNETAGYVTGVDSVLTQQAMQDYQTRVQNYIQQNHPNATVGDVLGKKEIVKKEYPYLLGTLPYKTAVKGGSFAVMPDSFRHKLSFNVTASGLDETPIALTMSLPELAGKKITLSYSPATAQDEAVIKSYLPLPHSDGTPVLLSELPSLIPAYLIGVRSELRIDGQVVATGAVVGLGSTESFVMNFYDPATGETPIINSIAAGTYQAIGLNLGRVGQDQLDKIKLKIDATKAKFQNSDFTSLSKDDLIGDLLYATALSYHAEIGTMNFIAAKTMGVNAITLPSESIFANQVKVDTVWGIPTSVGAGGLNMDADRMLSVVKAKDGNSDTVKEFMFSNGMTSSVLEHSVPEQLFSTPENQLEGISAAKALKIANDEGIPIYSVTQANVSTFLPQLQVGQEVKSDIQDAVNAGKVVTVSKRNISINGWTGCGYIITDPESGAGAYMISGGLSGGWISVLQGILHGMAGVLTGIAGLLIFAYMFPLAGAAIIALSIIYIGLALCEITSDSRYIDVSVGASTAIFPELYAITKLMKWVFWAVGATVTFSGNFFKNVCGG